MTPEDFEYVRRLFHEARDRPNGERIAYLEQACPEREDIRREVSFLIDQEDAPHQLLAITDTPGALRADLASLLNVDADGELPCAVGRYQIQSKLGEGGMGIVYLAQQDRPARDVALKVLRAGVASRSTLRRFEHEAGILAYLEHPGIAQVFEAGAAEMFFGDGAHTKCHFFAMEYVRGASLIQFADSESLNIRQRLALLARVCDAVQHAHQKGVIHRDLKPGNVLVDAQGQPKVLDFGVARATDSDVQTVTLQTEPGQLIGTMPYMSPEQVSGFSGRVDVRSDVYALGVIGYELLTGRLPHDVRNLAIPQAVRVIEGADVTPLSAINRTLRGDVETIVQKALEKDVSRRYQSAADLATDIRHYLSDQPIAARPATTFYHLRKFARRNKTVVTAASVFFLAMCGGMINITIERNRAQVAERLAQQRSNEIEQQASMLRVVNDFLHKDLLGAADPNEPQRSEVTVREVLDRASARIEERFRSQPLQEAAIRGTVGVIYQNLGEYETAEKHLLRALELRRRELGEDHRNTLMVANGLANLYKLQGRFQEAEKLQRATTATARRTLGERDYVTLTSMTNLGTLCLRLGQSDEAEQLLQDAYQKQREAYGEENEATLGTMNNLAQFYAERGRDDLAEALLRKTLRLSKKLMGANHPSTLKSMNNLGTVLKHQGRFRQAVTIMEEACERQSQTLGEEHPSTLICRNALGQIYGELGRHVEEEALHRKTLEIRRRVLGEEHAETYSSRANLAAAQCALGRYEEAEPLLLRSLAFDRRVLGNDHPLTLVTISNLASVYSAIGQYEKAEPLCLEALERRRRVLGPDHPRTLTSMSVTATLYKRMGRFKDSEEIQLETIELKRKKLGEDHPNTLNSLNNLANLYGEMGRLEEAETLHVSTLERRRALLGENHPKTLNSICNLAEVYRLQTRYAESEVLFRQALTGLRKKFGGDHERSIEALEGLVKVLIALDKKEEATALGQELCTRTLRVYGPNHNKSKDARKWLDQLLKTS